MKKIFIYSKRVARDLIRKGYTVIDISENQKNKDWTVFIFKDTPDLRDYLDEIWDLKIAN